MLRSASDSAPPNDRPASHIPISIIIPAWNEASQIAATIHTLKEFTTRSGRSIELVLVDDGSTDRTLETANAAYSDQAGQSQPLTTQFLSHPANRGKGAAVRTGLAAARGDRILLCDADLSTSIDQLSRLEAAVTSGCEIAIASRDMPDSRLDPPQPILRRLLAWTFRSLRRRILLPEIRDTQCGFKLLTRRAVNAILPELSLNGWLYDCELLALAQEKGLRICEIGVVWHDRRDSRVRPIRDLLPTLRELLALRRRFRSRRK